MSAAPSPARQETLRHHNLGLVLRQIVDAPAPLSRADIAAATGLTRATVSALVDRLVSARLVAELAPVAAQRAGRPAVPLVPAVGTVAAVGLEVNVDYLGVRVVDVSGAVLAEQVERADFRSSDPGQVLRRLGDVRDAVVGPVVTSGVRMVGAALALPGLVDRRTGPLRVAPNLGWHDVDVLALLPDTGLHSPPWLGNEANLAARAEIHARRGDGPGSFLYVSGEVGIGAAIVLDGAIFTGRHGWSGEIGNTVLPAPGGEDRTGPSPATCTLEQCAGQDAILDRAGLPRATTAEQLRHAAQDGDPAVLASLAVAGQALGMAIANVVNVVDVEHVVLGGTHAVLAEHLTGPVTAALRDRVISAPWASVEVSVARAGEYPALTGAALAVLRAVVEDPASSAVLAPVAG
jgi:predicted NBD/HSP70 family sugar kinase